MGPFLSNSIEAAHAKVVFLLKPVSWCFRNPCRSFERIKVGRRAQTPDDELKRVLANFIPPLLKRFAVVVSAAQL